MPRKDGSIGNYFLRLKEEEKIQRRNDYLYKERQRRLAEEKRKRLLGRLSNSHDTAFRHLVSFEAKLKDLNLIEKIKHQLFTETTEEGKQRFLDMLNQINKLKDIDVNQYVQDLEKELDPIQEEIDAIIKAKLIEERLNKFVNTFSDFRKKQINKRCVLSDNFKVIDNKFKTTMSDKMHYALNKKSTLKNIITHYK
jgi:vacuolar-type H+-ATPase subunit I/STV1